MNRRKKFRLLLSYSWERSNQVPVVKGQSSGVVHGRAVAVSAESNQAISLELMIVDENMLDHARTQWQFGDWDSLGQIDLSSLQHYPDRAKLELLAAAGHYNAQDNNTTRQLIRLAQEWSCSKKI